MSQLPEGTLGDAIGVLFFTFVCFITNVLLLWLYWKSHDELSCAFLPIPHPPLVEYIN
jgi:hypothetical protein